METIETLGCRWYKYNDLYVPSVTSILGLFVPYELQDWFKRTDEDKIDSVLNRSSKKGEEVHTICENFHLNKETYLPEQYRKICIEYFNYYNKLNPKAIAVEIPLYHNFGFAGRVDLICEVEGKLEIWDIKTGSVKIQAGWQMGAYAMAYEQMFNKPIQGLRVMNLSIKDNVFRPYEYVHLDYCKERFLHCFEVFKGQYFNRLKEGIRDGKGGNIAWDITMITQDTLLLHKGGSNENTN